MQRNNAQKTLHRAVAHVNSPVSLAIEMNVPARLSWNPDLTTAAARSTRSESSTQRSSDDYVQVFYQGIDKVSKTEQKPSGSEEDPSDGADGDPTSASNDALSVEGGGDNVAEDAGDAGKEDEEQEEDGTSGEIKEMTDEELASR